MSSKVIFRSNFVTGSMICHSGIACLGSCLAALLQPPIDMPVIAASPGLL
jgi:hypothetical protein